MNSNQHQFAMFVDIKGWQALVVGGGPVALRKTKRLLEAGADVTVVSPEHHDDFLKLDADIDNSQKITILKKAYESTDINNARIVVAATNSKPLNRSIATDAKAINASVNVANDPASGDFIMPSLVDRSPLLIAISSGGASPVLSRLLTARIEAFVPPSFAKLADLAGQYRDEIKSKIDGWRLRRRFWERQLGGHVGELVMQGREKDAEAALRNAIENHEKDACQGEVYLVGAGPGDADLLCFRALRLMQHVDIVFYDRLVSDAVMALVKPDAEKIYVGKRNRDHAVPQDNINQLLVKHAKEGKRVLRLKGGDPFIFGRGGEEIEELADNNVSFQVVPGITAASGCASYAGIPLTHRDHAQACVFVTGHLKNDTVHLNWELLTQPNQTVVIYMGLIGLPVIVEQLVQHGMSTTTPVALISRGTTAHQQVVTGTLTTISDLVATAVNDGKVSAPTLIIVGDVVTLQNKLSWFQ